MAEFTVSLLACDGEKIDEFFDSIPRDKVIETIKKFPKLAEVDCVEVCGGEDPEEEYPCLRLNFDPGNAPSKLKSGSLIQANPHDGPDEELAGKDGIHEINKYIGMKADASAPPAKKLKANKGNDAPAKKLSGSFTISQKKTKRFLDAYENTNDNKAVTRTSQTDGSQTWTLTSVGGNAYTIQQKKTSMYLDAHETSGKDYAVVTRKAQGNNSQKWLLTSVGDGEYTIRQKKTGRYLDAYEKSDKDHSAVTRTAQKNDSQKWILAEVS